MAAESVRCGGGGLWQRVKLPSAEGRGGEYRGGHRSRSGLELGNSFLAKMMLLLRWQGWCVSDENGAEVAGGGRTPVRLLAAQKWRAWCRRQKVGAWRRGACQRKKVVACRRACSRRPCPKECPVRMRIRHSMHMAIEIKEI